MGRLTSALEPDRTMTFAYDAAGRLRRETRSENGMATPLVTEYGYDVAGRTARIDYPSGLSISFDRDAAGQVQRVRTTDGGTTYADAADHWPAGPLKAFTFGSGEGYSFTPTRRYEPAALRSGPLALDYTMTASGDVGTIQEGTTSSAFTYDYRDRLVAFTPGYGNGSEVTHEYAGTYGWPWPFTDRLKRSGTFSGTTLVSGWAFDYDYQTNLSSIGRVVNGSVTTALCLRHDSLGRLVIVGTGTNRGGDSISCTRDSDVTSVAARYGYDARNRRVTRWLAATGDWTYFVHGQSGELLSELRWSGGTWVPVRDYVWLDGRPLAQVEYGPSGERRTYFIHADHLGMPRRLTSALGAVVWSATTQPYGEVTETVTPDPVTAQIVVTNLRLPGQYDERLLTSVGLQGPYYNWNRWYLPSVGRYLELDPVGLTGAFNSNYGVSWYQYAEENPLTRFDEEGLGQVITDKRRCEAMGCPAQVTCARLGGCELNKCGRGTCDSGLCPEWGANLVFKLWCGYVCGSESNGVKCEIGSAAYAQTSWGSWIGPVCLGGAGGGLPW